jgi:hypothetical protein
MNASLFAPDEIETREKDKRILSVEEDLKQRRRKVKDKQFFSDQLGRLQYCGERLPKDILDESRSIYEGHVLPVLTQRKCLEAMIFCIASQGLVFERASEFANMIKGLSSDEIGDPELVHKRAIECMRFKEDRFSPFYEFVSKYQYGILGLAKDFLEKPKEVRLELAKEVSYVGLKTASFWNLCLGGKELMTLDVHNLRQIGGLKVAPIKESHYLGQRRETSGKWIATTPSDKDYLHIEDCVLTHFGYNRNVNPELFEKDGSLNAALLTSLFWWEGVKKERGVNPYQRTLFGNLDLATVLPYHDEEIL